MKNILIIEDEDAAARRIVKMVAELLPGANILPVIGSVQAGITYLQQNPQPDIIISDIHLADGQSFEIFKNAATATPIIFTTAYDQYALEAFKVNGIDYLLKPIKKEELDKALKKLNRIAGTPPAINMEMLLKSLHHQEPTYKERFAVRYGEHIKTIETVDIAYFYTENKANFLVIKDGKRFTIDHNLDQLESMLPPKNFFRINRQFIIGFHAITEMFAYSKSRVLVKLQPPSKLETIVSAERSASFKTWIDGG
jgi:two-component system, LytTR family, response regulator LytT